MKIEVTAEDIAQGQRTNCWCCPVARAARRAVGQRVRVAVTRISIGSGPHRGVYETSGEVQRWIDTFDRRGKVAPFSFELGEPRD